MPDFTPIEVYTITCTCSTGAVADLEHLSATLPVTGAILSCKSPAGVTRGDHRQGRSGSFGRNMSCTVRVASQVRPVHAKLFATGSIQMAGALSVESAYAASEHLCAAAGLDKPIDMRTRLMNCGMRASCRLNLARCRESMRERGIRHEYDPDRYSAVKACVFFGRGADRENRCACAVSCADKTSSKRLCQMVTVSVFESGAILISGGSSMANAVAAAARIQECLGDDVASSSDSAILERLKTMVGGLKGGD